MLASLTHILATCGTSDARLPPTELFNEGWMLRLVLDWMSRHPGTPHPLSFCPGASWYSEALLPSRFLPRFRRDTRAEGYTHADGLVGQFSGDRKKAVEEIRKGYGWAICCIKETKKRLC